MKNNQEVEFLMLKNDAFDVETYLLVCVIS